MSEKRAYSRKEMNIDILYSICNLNYTGKTCNVSPGGLFINSIEPFSTGKDILLSINLPNCSTTFKINGSITRSDKDGFGVKFKQPLYALGFSNDCLKLVS